MKLRVLRISKVCGGTHGGDKAPEQVFPLLLPILFIISCTSVPLTDRRQLSLIPASQMRQMGAQSYDEFIGQADVIEGTERAQMVKTVGRDVANAVERYMREHGEADQVKKLNWEFNLIQNDAANAFAMPGGKVAVFSGIMPIAETKTGLAVIMAHEVAHVIADHGNERMSQALLVQLGGVALNKALEEKPQLTRQLFLAAFGLGAQVGVLLPYSRLHESEADELGLVFMAMAGYDPREAVDFWQRMEKAHEGSGAPPEFLSTHPSHRTRIQNLKDSMPKALDYYNKQKPLANPTKG